MTEWRKIAGHERYEVSDDGRVVSIVPMVSRWNGVRIADCNRADLADALAYVRRRPLVLLAPMTGRPLTDEENEAAWNGIEREILDALQAVSLSLPAVTETRMAEDGLTETERSE